jgi:hypothetical protein
MFSTWLIQQPNFPNFVPGTKRTPRAEPPKVRIVFRCYQFRNCEEDAAISARRIEAEEPR